MKCITQVNSHWRAGGCRGWLPETTSRPRLAFSARWASRNDSPYVKSAFQTIHPCDPFQRSNTPHARARCILACTLPWDGSKQTTAMMSNVTRLSHEKEAALHLDTIKTAIYYHATNACSGSLQHVPTEVYKACNENSELLAELQKHISIHGNGSVPFPMIRDGILNDHEAGEFLLAFNTYHVHLKFLNSDPSPRVKVITLHSMLP